MLLSDRNKMTFIGSAVVFGVVACFLAARGGTSYSYLLQEQVELQPKERDMNSAFSCYNNERNLPNITILATGGTIAGYSESKHDTSKYQSGVLGVDSLIRAVPEICDIANIKGIQAANVGSHNVNSMIQTDLAQRVQRHLDDPYTQGVVVTHGTDTLEETAFFLDLTVWSSKPVAVVGAMRPASAYGADGPMNLIESVVLATHEEARDRGVMVVMNDRIGAARYTSKTNANRVDSFEAAEQGFLGTFESGRNHAEPFFFYPPSRPLGHRHFNITSLPSSRRLPKVDILYGHQELEPGLFRAAVDLGAKGVILAGVGGGWWPTIARREVDEYASANGVSVLTSRRPAWGYVDDSSGGVGCGFLDPQKCRIQLQLCLASGLGVAEIEDMFKQIRPRRLDASRNVDVGTS